VCVPTAVLHCTSGSRARAKLSRPVVYHSQVGALYALDK